MKRGHDSTPGPGAGRSRRFEMAGAFRRVRASEKYALGKEPSRQLPVRRPAGYYGVRIERCPCSSGAAGPCRGLVLCEPVRIRAVTGVRPRRSANAGCRRSLVRRTWWRDGYPYTGLAAGQPQRQRRDGRVRHGYSPRHPRTRPDMAGRQRQPVPVTRPADPMPCARGRPDGRGTPSPPGKEETRPGHISCVRDVKRRQGPAVPPGRPR
jgi:hypothetical protein